MPAIPFAHKDFMPRRAMVCALVLWVLALPAAAEAFMATGTYTGDGSPIRAVTGVGFQPDFVIVKSVENEYAVGRTATMPPGESGRLGEYIALSPDRILSLDADGFTIGDNNDVNLAGTVFHWVALRAGTGYVDVGSYTGDGSAYQAITGVGFQPAAVIVISDFNDPAILRTASTSAGISFPLRGDIRYSNGIIDLQSDGFAVGSDGAGNRAGVAMHYVAFNGVPGAVSENYYLGDGVDDRTLSGLGFEPEFMLVRGVNDEDGVFRTATMAGDATAFFQNRAESDNRIQAFTADGFVSGNAAEVNTNGTYYHILALANPEGVTDLRLQMGADDAAPNVGGTVTFTLELGNAGPLATIGTVVDAPLPAGLAFVSAVPSQGAYDAGTGAWTVGSLANGAAATLALTAVVEAGQTGATLSMIATADVGSPTESTPLDNVAQVELTVPGIDLIVATLVDDAAPDVDGTVVYTAAVTNAGPDDATGVAINGLLPAGLRFLTAVPSQGVYDDATGLWSVGTVPAARSATLTLMAAVEPGTGGQTLALPFAVAAVDQADANPANDTGTATITVTSSDLAVTKTVDLPSAGEGAAVTFRITVNNAGPSHATGLVVADALPAGLSFESALADSGSYDQLSGLWTIGGLAANEAAVLDVVARVEAGTGGQTLTNTALIAEADQEDPSAANDFAAATVTVSSTDLRLEKIVDLGSPNEGDLVTYTVTVTNDGPNDATGVAVTDSLPAGLTFVSATAGAGSYDELAGLWTVGDLADGGSETLQVSATVDPGTVGLTIVNRARISAADLADPTAANDSSFASLTVAGTDIQLTKDVDAVAPNEGATVVYTLTVTNAGPYDVGAVAVTDSLPAGLTFVSATPGVGSYDPPSGLWDVGALADGATATLLLTAVVDAGTAGATIVNTAAVSGADRADPVPANNTASAGLTVSSTDLRISKVVDRTAPEVGAPVVYTVAVTNAGPNAATGLVVRDLLPGGLALLADAPSRGAYDAAGGLWTVGDLGIGETATLTLTARIEASAAGRNIVNTAAVVAVDQADLDAANDQDSAAIDVPPVPSTPVVAVRTLGGLPATVHPGTAPRPVLRLELVNRGDEADTLRSLTLTNLSTASSAPDQATLDSEWSPLTVGGVRRGLIGADTFADLPATVFTDGKATLGGFAWEIGPGDTLVVEVEAAPSLAARDGAVLMAGVAAATDIGVRQTVEVAGFLPLISGHVLVADGFVAAQAAVIEVPSGTLAVDTRRNPAFCVDLPSNGYLADSLYGLTLVNLGRARAGDDIAAMEAWADDGDGLFSAATDLLLGPVVNSGELWQLTGLDAAVPPGGRRFHVTVDIAADAMAASEISLALPVEHGAAVIMASGNDGPVDLPLRNGGVLGITVADRLVLTTEDIAPGTAAPDARNLMLLTVNVANTYLTEQRLQSLTVRNATETHAAATTGERDAVVRQVTLRRDGDGDGLLDDVLTDPPLGSGSFSNGAITYSGLDLPLAAGGLERIFVTADVDPGAVADGDVLRAVVSALDDVWAPGAARVASWPLDSGAAWFVDGMIAAQVVSAAVPGRTLGPGDGPELALDLTIPANGYRPDRMVGLTLENEGSAGAADLAQVRLWADDGDGVFADSTDTALGAMNWLNGRWVSPVLSHDVPVEGVRIFVSIDAAAAPTDSATIRLAVPRDGIVMASENSGPVDTSVPPGGTLVLSTSALVSNIAFDAAATTVGQAGILRMAVRNVGTEAVNGITPDLVVDEGTASIVVGAVMPASFDLAPGSTAVFVWNYTATEPGTVTMLGSATGRGAVTTLDHASAPAPTAPHRVHTPVPRLDTYPTANLPASVARGASGLVPMTLTLVNPGGDHVATARLDSLRIRLAETVDGPAIVPNDLIDALVLSEGSNVYVVADSLPAAGDEFTLRLSPPALITGNEPLTLSLSIDLQLHSTVPSFVMIIDDSTSFHATDLISGQAVTTIMGEGAFPVMTRQADLVSPAGGLAVAVATDSEQTVVAGHRDVNVATLTLRNDSTDPTASPIRVQAVGFVPRTADGAKFAPGDSLFEALRLNGSSQLHFAGRPERVDSLMVLLLAPPVDVPVGANVVLEVTGDLTADIPLGAVRFDLADHGQWSAEDANDGSAVAVAVAPAVPVTAFTVVEPVSEIQARGAGHLPARTGLGDRDLKALSVSLVHPGGPGTAPAAWDSLTLQLFDGARRPRDPAGLFDRVRIVADGTTIASLIDPADADGRLALDLAAPDLAPGDTLDIEVRLDLSAEAPLGTFELILAPNDLVVRDAISGQQPALTALGAWPVWSGPTTVVLAAEEMTVGGASLMPALLAPQADLQPVLALDLTNSAEAGAGPLAVSRLALFPASTDNDFPRPGAAVASLAAVVAGVEVARNDSLSVEASRLTLIFDEPLLVEAGETVAVELRLGVRPGAPAGRLRLTLDATDLDVGLPGAPPGGIRVLAASGQVLPLETEVGNVGPVALADSYINFPNPFAAGGETTTFAYYLREAATVTLRLLTPHGESVALLVDQEARGAGLHQADTWDGRNGRGLVVRNGVYMAELTVTFGDGSRERVLRKVAVVR